jgi:ADP-heptose:LPS heptosyltransferase
MAQRLREINPNQRPVIVFHPGPTWQVREWPSPQWSELAELVSARTSAIMIKIGTDVDSMRRVRPLSPTPNVVDWTNKLDVIEIVALIEQASTFVGIDSGPLHVAGVLGVPSVALFGPISGQLRVHPRAQAIIVTSSVSCLGCHHRPEGPLHWRTGCPNDIACMRGIAPDEVFNRLMECLARHKDAIECAPHHC